MLCFDTDTPTGKLALTLSAASAEFRYGIRKERQTEGTAKARDEVRYRGRKPKLVQDCQVELAARWHAGGNHSELATEYGIDGTMALRIVKRYSAFPMV